MAPFLWMGFNCLKARAINDIHMMHGSWDMECNKQSFLSFWTVFCPFYPLNNSKNQNFEKMKHTPQDITILHRCTINDNHMMYHMRYRVQQTELFVILDYFLPFYPPKNQIKILKKWKYHLDVLSFYTCVPQMTIIWCMVPEIRSVTDRILVILDHFLHFYPSNNTKNQIFEKMKKHLKIS